MRHQGVGIGREHRRPCLGPLAAPAGCRGDGGGAGARAAPGWSGVDARGVVKEVIQRMGLDAAVRAACTDTAGAYTVDAGGNVLETYRAEDNDGDGYIS